MQATQTPQKIGTLEIRRAVFPEMSQIAEFVRSSAEWYRPILDPQDMEEHDVDEEWAVRNYKLRDFYLGVADGVPVGTISLQYFGDYAYLGYIYLDVAHVGKGYGQKLMKFAEGVARKKGMKGMCLIAHPKATWACKAYLKYGFDILETERDQVLAWNDGFLNDYYEEGFHLFLYDFAEKGCAV